jgi:hypothetical protein
VHLAELCDQLDRFAVICEPTLNVLRVEMLATKQTGGRRDPVGGAHRVHPLWATSSAPRLHPRAAKREEALQAAVANGGTFAPHKSGRAADGGVSAEARAWIEQMMSASAGGVSGAAAHADPSSSLLPAEAPSVNTSSLNIKTGSARPGRRPREIHLDSAAART